MEGHLLLQSCEFISPVDEKPDKIGKVKKGVIAVRLRLFDNLLCQSTLLGLTPLNNLNGVRAQKASLVMDTSSEEMVECRDKACEWMTNNYYSQAQSALDNMLEVKKWVRLVEPAFLSRQKTRSPGRLWMK